MQKISARNKNANKTLTFDLSQAGDFSHKALRECQATAEPQSGVQSRAALEVLILVLAARVGGRFDELDWRDAVG